VRTGHFHFAENRTFSFCLDNVCSVCLTYFNIYDNLVVNFEGRWGSVKENLSQKVATGFIF
jgi:hypothetical protein